MSKTNRPNRLLSLPLFVLIAIIIGLGGFYLIKPNSPTPLSINEVTTSGTVSLEASPAPSSHYLGEEFTLDINSIFEPNTEHVTAVQLELVYDPSKLQITNFAKTDYLPTYLSAPVISGGKLTVTLGAPADSGGRSTWGTVGKITIKPLALGTHEINFNDGTLVSGISSTGNVLKKVTSIVTTVVNVGDINRDKKVDLFDYNLFVRDYGLTTYSPADFNHSGKVDLFDYNLFVANYGLTSP